MERPASDDGRPAAPLRRMPVWVQRYVENRTLPKLLLWAIWVVFFSTQVILFRTIFSPHFMPILVVCSIVSLLCMLAQLWLALPRAAAVWERISQTVYTGEGTVQAPVLSKRRQTLLVLLIITGSIISWLGLRLIQTWVTCQLGTFPPALWQPTNALFLVPFVILLTRVLGHSELAWTNVFAVLYAAYTILLLIFQPTFLTTLEGGMLNFFVSFPGCLLIALLLGHLINRVALQHIRTLAQESLREGGEA